MIYEKYNDKLKNMKYPQKPREPIERDFSKVSDYANAKDKWINDMSEWREARKSYNREQAYIIDEFKRELLRSLGIADSPKAEDLWNMAWERGHSGGLSDVELEAEELAVLVK